MAKDNNYGAAVGCSVLR